MQEMSRDGEGEDNIEVQHSFVYLLVTHTLSNTYVGATVDLDRRLRQHNREIKGGAHATSIRVQKGEVWRRHCYVSGFPNWQAALQFEWRWKQISRKHLNIRDPLERRMQSLELLLTLDRSTTKAIPFSEWPNGPPQVHFC
jgi:structure-specific endonuclease subunit SLX1